MKTFLYNFDQICITIINSQGSQDNHLFHLEMDSTIIPPDRTPINGNHPIHAHKTLSWGRNHSSPQIGEINLNSKNMDLLTSMPPKAESLTYLLPNTISVKNLNKLINNHGKDKYMNSKSPFSTTMAQMLYVTAHTTLILLPLNLLTLRPKYSSSDSKDHKKYSLTNIFKILSVEQINLQVNMKISQKNIILVGSSHLHHSQTRERI